jgi:predicted TIM-barrel fold metal-dependent hydrolase
LADGLNPFFIALRVAIAFSIPAGLARGQEPPVVYPGPQDAPEGDRFDPGRLDSTLVVPETRVERFRFPVVDAHSHVYAKTPEAIGEWVKLMDRVNVRASYVLTGATGEEFRRLSAQYASAHPGRFVMFAGFVKDGLDAADYGERVRRGVREDVAAGAAGLGELTDKGMGFARNGDTLFFIDDPRFDPLWDEAGRLGVPVFVHIAEPAAFYEAPDEKNDLRRSAHWSLYQKGTPGFAALQQKFERVLERHRGTRFVAVHAFNLANDLAAVGKLLDRHPNVDVDFAARMWELGRQPFTARRFFEKYQDRILFGTDNDPDLAMYLAHVRQLETEDEWFWSADAEWWRSYGMNLPPKVLAKVYRSNAERWIMQGDEKRLNADNRAGRRQ